MMILFLRKVFWIVLLVFINNHTRLKATENQTWGNDCPVDCECYEASSTQTHVARWRPENSTVKTALCLVKNDTLEFVHQLPNDTETLTFLQTNEHSALYFTRVLFEKLTEMQGMDLQGSLSNVQTYIENDVFHDMSNLKYLSLQKVNITGSEKAFSKLSSLEVLYVIHCTLGYLKWEMLDGLKNLKELYIVHSGIKELYGFAFYGTPELRRLFLSHNDLFSVEADAFVGLLKLEYLDLSNNQIDHLSGLTFPPLPHLQWLELKHNPIKVIFPHCFQYLNGTQHLTLGHQHQPVHLMKFSFRGLYSLIFLHIPNIDNDILIEHMFYDLKSLLHLNLQGRIKSINDRAFIGAHVHLNKLILRKCQLEKLYKDSFYGLENLQMLDLSENFLHSLPNSVFHGLKTVKQIRLNSNMLKELSFDFFYPLQNLKSLAMYSNPWNCSCELKGWKENVIMSNYELATETCNGTTCSEKHILQLDNTFTPQCEFPETFKGKNVFYALKTLTCKKS